MTRWRRRMRDLLSPLRDRDIDHELQFHLDALAREFQGQGMSERDARLAARRRFGSVARTKDSGHDVRRAGALEDVVRELAHAGRRLARTPAFTLAAVATLALAIGANAAIFAVVHRIVLAPLPYHDSSRLVLLEHAFPRIGASFGVGMTAGLYHQYLDRARTLDGVAVYRTGEATFESGGTPERIRVAHTTASLASVAGVPAAVGRWFTASEDTPGAPLVAVLSHGLWMSRYGRSPSVLGRAVVIDGVTAEIVGVMPPSFAIPDPRVEAWVPIQVSRASGYGLPYSLTGVGRLRDGAQASDLRTELNAVIADLPNVYPDDAGVRGNVGVGGLTAAPLPLKDGVVGDISRALWILLAAVGVVLLIAGANVANLFLVRSESRQREIGVRRALGATGPRIARFFLAESLLLSLAGGLVGLGFAWAAVSALVRLGPTTLPRLGEVRIDLPVVGFTMAISALAGIAFGAIPLWRNAPGGALLRDLGRGLSADRRRFRTRHALMGAQVALALILIVASALMVRSFLNLRALDPGFDPGSVLTFRVGLPERGYPTREAAVDAHYRILDELAASPGVLAVSATTVLPLAPACFGNSILIEGRLADEERKTPTVAVLCGVSHDHVAAMGFRLRRGRALTRDDVERREARVLVNEAFATRNFPQQDPLGKRFRSNAPPPPNAARGADGQPAWDGAPPWLEIVGVVANTPLRALAEPNPVPVVYMPMSIGGGPGIPEIAMLGSNISTMSYVVRTTVPPSSLTSSIRRAVDAVDPGLAVAQVRELQDIVDEGSAQMAFTMVLLSLAAGVALSLGIVGIYGVVSYIVSQRTDEIGVRLALGAEPHGIVRLIVRQGLTVSAFAAAVGVAAALAGGRFVESLLYGVSPRDPVIVTGATMVIVAVALVACWLPARRAARINPIDALRIN